MKREGRQHGMVRTYRVLPSPYNPREGSRVVNRLDDPPAAGLFAKVPSKPTNHSKFTGKCGKARCTECHTGPVHKSKDKAKGSHKLKSGADVVSSHRLITWRVVDDGHSSNFAGLSATGLLDDLAYDSTANDESYHRVNDASDDYAPEMEAYKLDVHDDIMSFLDVGSVLADIEVDEGWCLVGEMA